MRWSARNSEWHGWHTNAFPLKFLDTLRIVDSGVDAQIGFQKRQTCASGLALEGEPQTELDLARSTQRVHACSNSHTIHVMALWSGPINLACGSRQQPV
jgi:hypothetical protein